MTPQVSPLVAPEARPSDRPRLLNIAQLLAVGSILLIAVFVAGWIALLPASPARNDFAPGYASALLLREGRPDAIYNAAAQRAALAAVSGDASPTTSPAALAPPAVLLEVPLTLLPLWLASDLWALLQLLLLVAAAWIALRAVPPKRGLGLSARVFIVVAAANGGGALMLLSLNQWDGVAALGLALVYSELRRGHDAHAMAWLALTVLAGKPHLGLGIALFIAARRPRSVIALVATAGGVYGLTLLAVPPSAIVQWFTTVIHVGALFPISTTIGLSGLVSSTLGTGPSGVILGLSASAATLATAAVVGRRDARRARSGERDTIGWAGFLFTCVTLLSLLSAPHVYPYDLVLLIPGFVACAAWCATEAEATRWPLKRQRAVLALWGLLTLICWTMIWPPGSYRPSLLLPLLLLGSATICAGATLRSRARFAVG